MVKRVSIPPRGFDDLSVEEQIDYVQDLWDWIAARPEVPVPDWQKALIDEPYVNTKPIRRTQFPGKRSGNVFRRSTRQRVSEPSNGRRNEQPEDTEDRLY